MASQGSIICVKNKIYLVKIGTFEFIAKILLKHNFEHIYGTTVCDNIAPVSCNVSLLKCDFARNLKMHRHFSCTRTGLQDKLYISPIKFNTFQIYSPHLMAVAWPVVIRIWYVSRSLLVNICTCVTVHIICHTQMRVQSSLYVMEVAQNWCCNNSQPTFVKEGVFIPFYFLDQSHINWLCLLGKF